MGLFKGLFNGGNKDNKGPIVCAPKTVYSPVKGQKVALKDVPDEAFSSGVLGKGLGVMPEEGALYAPVDGTVEALFPTNHALGLRTADGMELLLHIGLDTVTMKGEGFHAFVKAGDFVKAGKLLVRFDIDKIRAHGLNPVTLTLVSNADALGEIKISDAGEFEALDRILWF